MITARQISPDPLKSMERTDMGKRDKNGNRVYEFSLEISAAIVVCPLAAFFVFFPFFPFLHIFFPIIQIFIHINSPCFYYNKPAYIREGCFSCFCFSFWFSLCFCLFSPMFFNPSNSNSFSLRVSFFEES